MACSIGFAKFQVTLSLVPTPSVPETKIGSLYPAALRSNRAPNDPSAAIQPDLLDEAARGLIACTRLFPAAISTPASL